MNSRRVSDADAEQGSNEIRINQRERTYVKVRAAVKRIIRIHLVELLGGVIQCLASCNISS